LQDIDAIVLILTVNHLLAPLIFGPPEQSVNSTTSLNTSTETIYQLISGKTKHLPENGLPLFVDVRDVAEAHVRALKNDSVIGKRVLLSGGPYTLYEICRSG
jgi:nucleoside-diphosphate-sugar epimerase